MRLTANEAGEPSRDTAKTMMEHRHLLTATCCSQVQGEYRNASNELQKSAKQDGTITEAQAVVHACRCAYHSDRVRLWYFTVLPTLRQ